MQENAMEVVGIKSLGAATIYFIACPIIAILGIFMVGLPSVYSIVFGILTILMAVMLLCFAIHVLIIPNDLIAVNETAVILLKKNQEIPFSNIASIISRRATAGGISYTYGKIVIETTGGNIYKQDLIADVENVAKVLNKKLRN